MAVSKTATLDPIACCTPVRTEVLDEDQADDVGSSLAALSDPIRLRMLSPSRQRTATRSAPAISPNRPVAPSPPSATT